MKYNNNERQKRFRELTKEVLRWYEGYTGYSVKYIRTILRKERLKNEKKIQDEQT